MTSHAMNFPPGGEARLPVKWENRRSRPPSPPRQVPFFPLCEKASRNRYIFHRKLRSPLSVAAVFIAGSPAADPPLFRVSRLPRPLLSLFGVNSRARTFHPERSSTSKASMLLNKSVWARTRLCKAWRRLGFRSRCSANGNPQGFLLRWGNGTRKSWRETNHHSFPKST